MNQYQELEPILTSTILTFRYGKNEGTNSVAIVKDVPLLSCLQNSLHPRIANRQIMIMNLKCVWRLKQTCYNCAI